MDDGCRNDCRLMVRHHRAFAAHTSREALALFRLRSALRARCCGDSAGVYVRGKLLPNAPFSVSGCSAGVQLVLFCPRETHATLDGHSEKRRKKNYVSHFQKSFHKRHISLTGDCIFASNFDLTLCSKRRWRTCSAGSAFALDSGYL